MLKNEYGLKKRNIRFKVADTEEELQKAYKLLHDVYVHSGLMTPQPSGKRIIINHSLPDSVVFVGKCDERVIATVTLFPDNIFPLPIDTLYRAELDSIRKNRKIAEIGCLAVDPDYRNNNMGMYLNKIIINYTHWFTDVDEFVITVHPRHTSFYEGTLGFKIFGDTKDYDYVCGHPATPMRIYLPHMEEIYFKRHPRMPLEKDIHHFIFNYYTPLIHLIPDPAEKPEYTWTQDTLKNQFDDIFQNTKLNLADIISSLHRIAQRDRRRSLKIAA